MSWTRKNVKGDGSCFYRSLYVSAENYPFDSLVSDILKCFGIKLNNINEETFVEAIRKSLGNKIINGIYDKKIEYEKELVLTNTSIESENARKRQINDTLGLYEFLVNKAQEQIDSSNSSSSNSSSSNSSSSNIGLYTAIMEEITAEINDEYGDPYKLINTSKEDFYNFIGKNVKDINVWASDYDINLVKYLLQKCNIYINNFEDKKYTKLVDFTIIRTPDGLINMNTLNIQRVRRNHYNAWIKEKGTNRKTYKNKNKQNNSTIQTLKEKILHAKEERELEKRNALAKHAEKLALKEQKEENNNLYSNTESVRRIINTSKNDIDLEKKLKMRKWLKKIQTRKNQKNKK